jgi:hypothetical protein
MDVPPARDPAVVTDFEAPLGGLSSVLFSLLQAICREAEARGPIIYGPIA